MSCIFGRSRGCILRDQLVMSRMGVGEYVLDWACDILLILLRVRFRSEWTEALH